MDYESIIKEIGQFGRWQKIVYFNACIIALVEAFMTFGFSFVGYTPKFRCRVPSCDLPDSNNYNSDFLNFSIPLDEDGDLDQCRRFKIGNESLNSCSPDLFSPESEVCSDHVYDTSVYENSIIAELDLAPCDGADPDWPFGVMIQALSSLSQENCDALSQIFEQLQKKP